ncbi:MAG: hypothetical protein ACRDR6_27225, partial [Pseudonocardiaceae bacterium]
MARRTFQMIDVVEVLQHWHVGRPKLVLSASLGVDPKTVRKYVAPAGAEGIVPGDGLVLDRAGWAARVAVWFPELTDARARSATWPVLEARRELIESMLATNTVATVHQRLRDEHDVRVSVTSLRRYVWQTLPDRRCGAQPTVLRPDVQAGLETLCGHPHMFRHRAGGSAGSSPRPRPGPAPGVGGPHTATPSPRPAPRRARRPAAARSAAPY